MPGLDSTDAALAEADHEAAISIKDRPDWKAIHDQWYRRTRINLSPASFGDRILLVKSKLTPNNETPNTQAPSQARSRPPSLQPQQSSQAPEHHGHFSNNTLPPPPNGVASYNPSNLANQPARIADVQRLDGIVSQLQSDVRDLRATMEDVRHELHRRPTPGTRDYDDSSFEILSETVTNTASKVAEIDGMKIQLETLKRRVRKFEKGAPGPPTPSAHDNHPRPSSSSLAPHTSFQSSATIDSPKPQVEAQPRAWNAVNANNKRPSLTEDEHAAGGVHSDYKRIRPNPSENSYHPSTQQSSAYAPSYATPDNHLAPIQNLTTSNQGGWRAPTLPAFRGGQSGRGRGGRSRKSPPASLGTPPWERESWNNKEVDTDGYYRPLGGVPISPNTADRGRVIRRGSGGNFQYLDHTNASSKKTRQKPIRNAEGILIRKDGKPDLRSISSPMNLKKVHARKTAEVDANGQPIESQSPHMSDSMDSPVGGSDESPTNAEEESYSPPSEEQPKSKSRPSTHGAIMKQMFPHGVDDDSHRMHGNAAQLFGETSPSGTRVRIRNQRVRDEVRASVEEHAETEGEESRKSSGTTIHSHETAVSSAPPSHDHDQPMPDSERQVKWFAPPSGKYEPSAVVPDSNVEDSVPQSTNGKEDAAMEDIRETATTATTATVEANHPTPQIESSLEKQQSMDMPPPASTEKTGVHQESGSVYEPSSTNESG